MHRAAPGFIPGALLGALLAAASLVLADASGGEVSGDRMQAWVVANLGHSAWAFAVVLMLWTLNVMKLARLLDGPVDRRRVVQLDQLTDVWIHLFIGIGVVWTAIGMRGALQATLGDPEAALSDTAGSVLRSLVDGGILLALTTTIVGAVGGYLMRLGKTLWVGPALHAHYDAEHGREVRELLAAAQRIEARLTAASTGTQDAGSPDPGGEDHAAAV